MMKMNLHLGCGERYIPGFKHIDIRKFPHIDYVTSTEKLDMFQNNTIDLIYACHLLEHFSRNKINEVLKEWYRVLKPNGILRISVPDFQKLVKIYQKYRDMGLILGPLYGRQDYKWNTHHIGFDFKSSKKTLLEAGFKNVKRYDYKKTIHKDYDDYSQAYTKGILISLNVEAIK